MRAIDLFAGVGGFSEGARLAGCRVVWAANHWRAAVDVHARNHPDTEHACQDLHQADWSSVPAHDLLLASPACQGHSLARGKERPHHDAQRSTAWAVVSAAEYHKPEAIIVENVPEFAKWALYRVWCETLNVLGYAMAPMILDAADHGVPQHRRRLFIVCTRSRYPLRISLPRRPHVPVSTIIDFDAGNWTPLHRPGRAAATIARVKSGRARFGDRFVAPFYGSGSGETGRSLDRPLGTITTRDRWLLVDGDRVRILTVDENRAGMGFRSGYALPERRSDAVHMLGNAVCPVIPQDLIDALRRAA